SKKDILSFEDIKNQSIIGFYKAPEQYWLDGYFKKYGYKPKTIIECSKDSSVAEFVKNGFGIAFCPEISTPSIHAEGITTLPLEDFDVTRTIYASWPKEFVLTNASKTFVDFGVEYFKSIGE
ncbi:MAG: LysR family transcriptional regulator substrate-binding protein, partial [Oscillospiraceae bacterium]|nr:LysR family transcriptional regulator substrate-binding protein [Oscillospiraceae bacterium]